MLNAFGTEYVEPFGTMALAPAVTTEPLEVATDVILAVPSTTIVTVAYVSIPPVFAVIDTTIGLPVLFVYVVAAALEPATFCHVCP